MNIAFIPVRGGSKSIPLKNIKKLNGKPLVYWVIKAACDSKSIDRVYVSTDSGQIRSTVESFGLSKVCVVDRSAGSASDTASTEYAMLEFAERHEFENIALIQATSPLLKAEDIDGGFELFNSSDCDSVLSVVRQYRFIWKKDDSGIAKPINYDVYDRPRRQDFDGYLMENGAFYITSRKALLESKNRVSGRIKAYEMPADTAFEIDEPSDWIIVGHLMKKNAPVPKVRHIKLFLTDCDGCLTDGGMYYSESGDELKKFNTRDGAAFAMLKDKGIITGIITGENMELNRRRAEKMHIDELYMGVKDKLTVVNMLAEKYHISLEEVAYIGDDINDISCMEMIKSNGGIVGCPADAVNAVKEISDFIAEHKGGEGAVRDFIEFLF